ncbi:MAG TPA: DNA methyltransferase, partial [Methylococcales bacterium]
MLTDSGSIFVQIGDENVHRVRAVMDEVFGGNNFVACINYVTTSGFPSLTLTRAGDSVIWYARETSRIKYRQLFNSKGAGDDASAEYKLAMLEDGTLRPLSKSEFSSKEPLPFGARRWRYGPLTFSGASDSGTVDFEFHGRKFHPGIGNHWKVNTEGLGRVAKSELLVVRKHSIAYYLFAKNYLIQPITNIWDDTKGGFDASEKGYVVQKNSKVTQKYILMTTDPGDLVLDPT